MARTIDAAITSSQDIPQTKADQKRKITDAKITAAKKHRMEHDKVWYNSLQSPAHYGEWLGMTDVLGPPPKRPERTNAERAEEGMEAAKRVLRAMRRATSST